MFDYDLILNKKESNNTLIASVVTVSPLTVELIPGDNPIPVIATSNLSGLKAGSRVVLQRYGKQFIATNVIAGFIYAPIIVKQAGDITVNDSTDFVDLMSITLPADSGFWTIKAYCRVLGRTTSNAKLVWAVSGSYTFITRFSRGGPGTAFDSTTGELHRNSYHGLTTVVAYGGNNYSSCYSEVVSLEVGNTDLLLTLRGSQFIKTVVNTTFYANSFIEAVNLKSQE